MPATNTYEIYLAGYSTGKHETPYAAANFLASSGMLPLWERMYIEECDSNGISRTITLPQYCWRDRDVSNLISRYILSKKLVNDEVALVNWRQEGF